MPLINLRRSADKQCFFLQPGWKAILVVWFYSLLWWTASDAAKTLIQRVRKLFSTLSFCAKLGMACFERHWLCCIALLCVPALVLMDKEEDPIQVFRAHDVIIERAKVTLEETPWWVKVLDAPGNYGDMAQKKIAKAIRGCTGSKVRTEAHQFSAL